MVESILANIPEWLEKKNDYNQSSMELISSNIESILEECDKNSKALLLKEMTPNKIKEIKNPNMWELVSKEVVKDPYYINIITDGFVFELNEELLEEAQLEVKNNNVNVLRFSPKSIWFSEYYYLNVFIVNNTIIGWFFNEEI